MNPFQRLVSEVYGTGSVGFWFWYLIQKAHRLGHIRVSPKDEIVWAAGVGNLAPPIPLAWLSNYQNFAKLAPLCAQSSPIVHVLGVLRNVKYSKDVPKCPVCQSTRFSKTGNVAIDMYPSFICHDCARVFHQCPRHGTNTPGTNIYSLDEASKAIEPERVTCTCQAKGSFSTTQRQPDRQAAQQRPVQMPFH